jgi:hypothetical protein
MEAKRGIPDDTPENTVENIRLILSEEADEIGAVFKCNDDKENTSHETELTVRYGERSFRMLLIWTESQYLPFTRGSIGNGFISNPRWDLELLHGEPDPMLGGQQLGWNPGQDPPGPPFRWGLYPEDADYLTQKPVHILDGTLLRKMLRQSLSLLPA